MTCTDDILIDLSVLGTEPAEDYHARAGEYLSSHQLLDFMACPWLFRKKQLGLARDEGGPALFIGQAFHTRTLEGRDEYERRYALGGPINKSTGKPYGATTKAFSDWAAAQGKPGIHHDDLELIENMAAGVAANDEAVDLLVHGRAEGVVRAEYGQTPCQIRIDWTHPFRGIVDLKSTADLTWFEAECRRRRYHNQLAFYQSVLAVVVGQRVPVHIIAVEKIEPFRCGVWRVGDDTLAIARAENEAAIARLRRCRELDSWPTGYETVRILDFP
ncbi:MAG: Exodeoxyribonuclease 8 [Phycisphaerae bacterium]|nr:Exodeoxyribonuclease 8 [Phycisphaerae bacterium]